MCRAYEDDPLEDRTISRIFSFLFKKLKNYIGDDKMRTGDSHIILYSKFHYERRDLVEDLKILVGNRCCLDPAIVTNNDIANVLIDIALEHTLPQCNPARFIRELIFDLAPNNRWKFGASEEDCYELALIKKLLSFIRNTKVRNGDLILIDLEDPDPKILPLSSAAKNKID